MLCVFAFCGLGQITESQGFCATTKSLHSRKNTEKLLFSQNFCLLINYSYNLHNTKKFWFHLKDLYITLFPMIYSLWHLHCMQVDKTVKTAQIVMSGIGLKSAQVVSIYIFSLEMYIWEVFVSFSIIHLS